MISNDLLKKKILDSAICGELTNNDMSLKSVSLSEVKENVPFELPSNWKWVKYSDIAESKMGKTILSSELVSSGIPVYSATQSDEIFGYVTDSTIKLQRGDIVIPARGNSIGYVTMVKDSVATCTQTTIYSHLITDEVYPKYLTYCCKKYRTEWFKYSGAAIPQVTVGQINKNLVPVPPFKTQVEIVEKIDKLFNLIDKKEKNDNEKKKLKSILKLKVLDLAIHGKLVSNDLSQKPIDIDKIDIIPFEIPSNWIWSDLGKMAIKISDGTHSTPKYCDSGIPFLSVKDMSDGKLHFDNCKYISKEEHDLLYKRCDPKRNDLLITKVGTTGVPVIVDTDEEFSIFVSVAQLRFDLSVLYLKYIKYVVLSKYVQDIISENTRGAANKNWVIKDIKKTTIPLPPLEEQKRIVEKIESLFELIEQL